MIHAANNKLAMTENGTKCFHFRIILMGISSGKSTRMYHRKSKPAMSGKYCSMTCFTLVATSELNTTQNPSKFITMNALITNLAKRDHLCNDFGPVENAVSAMSAYVSDGTCVRRHNRCEHCTKICTQYAQMTATMNVFTNANQMPPLAKANGIAKMPAPKDAFIKWNNVSQLLHGKSQKNTNKFQCLSFSCQEHLHLLCGKCNVSMCKWIIVTSSLITWQLFKRERWTQRRNRRRLEFYFIHFKLYDRKRK